MQTLLMELFTVMGWSEVPAWAAIVISCINVLLIVAAAFIARTISRRLLDAAHQRLLKRTQDLEERKRIDTLDRIFNYIASVVITILAIMLIMDEFGVSIAPFLAAAGVVGIAVSFGAQSLVKDYFTGFVMLIENQIRQGDFIEAGGKSGAVEEVTLRYVRLRDGEGAVHFIPNSQITTVTNRSREFAYTVVEVGVAYGTPLEKAFEVIKQAGDRLQTEPDMAGKFLGTTEIQGVTQLADSAVTIRMRVKVPSHEQWVVKRRLLAAIKTALDQAGIEIPFPQRVVHTISEK
jgi:moderate conductance mechanosensitive channel